MDDWIVGLMQINPGDSVNVSLYQRAKVYSLRTYSVKYVASLKMAGFFFDKNSSGKKISEFFQRQFFPGFLIQIIWKTCSCLVAVHGSPAVRADIEVV